MSKRVVLLVEDDADDVDLTKMALKDLLEPYEVVLARDGVEALEYLLGTGPHAGRDVKEVPALIILDMNLPRVSGTQVLQRLNQEWGPGLAGVRVAILSSSYIEPERVAMKKLGIRVHIPKPISSAQTLAMVQEIGRLLDE